MGLGVLGNGFAPLLAQYARRGVPMSLRARVAGALRRGERVGEREYHYYASLLREVDRVALASDAACKHDANLPLLEDPYFVFAEQVEEVLSAHARPAGAQTPRRRRRRPRGARRRARPAR